MDEVTQAIYWQRRPVLMSSIYFLGKTLAMEAVSCYWLAPGPRGELLNRPLSPSELRRKAIQSRWKETKARAENYSTLQTREKKEAHYRGTMSVSSTHHSPQLVTQPWVTAKTLLELDYPLCGASPDESFLEWNVSHLARRNYLRRTIILSDVENNRVHFTHVL